MGEPGARCFGYPKYEFALNVHLNHLAPLLMTVGSPCTLGNLSLRRGTCPSLSFLRRGTDKSNSENRGRITSHRSAQCTHSVKTPQKKKGIPIWNNPTPPAVCFSFFLSWTPGIGLPFFSPCMHVWPLFFSRLCIAPLLETQRSFLFERGGHSLHKRMKHSPRFLAWLWVAGSPEGRVKSDSLQRA